MTRRASPDIACTGATAHIRCTQFFGRFKQVALPAFGYEDDLFTMPYSALAKIRFGGLAWGTRRLLGEAVVGDGDIDALLTRVAAHYGDMVIVPCGELVGDIAGCKPRRRK